MESLDGFKSNLRELIGLKIYQTGRKLRKTKVKSRPGTKRFVLGNGARDVVRRDAHQQQEYFESCFLTRSGEGVALGASTEPGTVT